MYMSNYKQKKGDFYLSVCEDILTKVHNKFFFFHAQYCRTFPSVGFDNPINSSSLLIFSLELSLKKLVLLPIPFSYS